MWARQVGILTPLNEIRLLNNIDYIHNSSAFVYVDTRESNTFQIV